MWNKSWIVGAFAVVLALAGTHVNAGERPVEAEAVKMVVPPGKRLTVSVSFPGQRADELRKDGCEVDVSVFPSLDPNSRVRYFNSHKNGGGQESFANSTDQDLTFWIHSSFKSKLNPGEKWKIADLSADRSSTTEWVGDFRRNRRVSDVRFWPNPETRRSQLVYTSTTQTEVLVDVTIRVE